MKKFLTLLALLLCVSLSMIVVKRVEANPDDIYVPFDYLTIQEAIDAAIGGDNDPHQRRTLLRASGGQQGSVAERRS
jgi:hypothetical protein